MRFDIHIRQSMRERLADVSARMAMWDQQQPASPDLHRRLVESIEPFERLVGRSVDEVLDGSDYADLSRGRRRAWRDHVRM
jgi:hypothetical protein